MSGVRETYHGGGGGGNGAEGIALESLEDFVQHVRRMARQEERIRSLLADSGVETSPTAADTTAHNGAYEQLIVRIREAVAASVAAGATVAVVSKGDPKLLELAGGRRAWHLPQTPEGVYAGHHPANGAEAVAQLEALRAKGAQFLLLPATSFWWLEHYVEFRRHLEAKYRRVRADDACVIFSLVAASGAADAPDVLARQARYQETIRRVRLAVTGAVPAGATVAVVSKGDANLVEFEGRRGWHFPRNDAGMWAGHHPADSDEAIRHLASLRSQGARYFVLPSTSFWWLDHYQAFCEHLEKRHRRLLADEHCVIFELRRESGRRSVSSADKRPKGARLRAKTKSQTSVRSKRKRRST
jgi:hypothetical protein